MYAQYTIIRLSNFVAFPQKCAQLDQNTEILVFDPTQGSSRT